MATHVFTANPKLIIPAFEFGDKVFKCSQVTAANLLDLQERLTRKHPGARIHVMQSCYHAGFAPSAGTHDKDACLDISATGLTWQELESFCRAHGWAAWWRHTGSWSNPSDFHIHMVSLAAFEAGCPVGIFVPGQVDDYHRHALGLKGQHDSGDDPTWHPKDIEASVFDYAAWLKQQEDNVAYKDWPKADRDALVQDVVSGILNAQVGPPEDLTAVRTALYRASNVPTLIRAQVQKIVSKLGA